MSEARTHAITASELLDGEQRLAERLHAMTPDENLRMVAGGHVGQLNRDREFSIQLAVAHALTALAMALTER